MDAFLAKLSNPVVIVALLVVFAIIVVIFLKKRVTKIAVGPGGAAVETDSACDLASVRNIQAAGTDIEVSAEGRGSSVEGVKIDRTSKNINIKSST